MKVQNVKKLEEPPAKKIRFDDVSHLILVRDDGTITVGKTRPEKDALVEEFQPSVDAMLWATYKNVYRLTGKDLAEHYR